GSLQGSVPERPKGADCKSAGTAFDGSNPSRPTPRSPKETSAAEDVDGGRRADATEVSAGVLYQPDTGARDLAPAGLTPKLLDDLTELGEPRDANGMTARDQPSTGVDRQVSAECSGAVAHQR